MSKLNTRAYTTAAAGAALLVLANVANAATATNTFQSRIVIQDDCTISATNTLDFGNQGLLNANVDASADFIFQCTNGTPYNVRLNAGTSAGGTVATRKMIGGGAATVDYRMYRDVARTNNWGETDGTDTNAGSGTGSSQTMTVYGRVPVQATPAADTYTDTVTITVNY